MKTIPAVYLASSFLSLLGNSIAGVALPLLVLQITGSALGAGAVALLLGPAAAGTLLVLRDGAIVLWVTAATSLAAAALTLLIPRRVGELPASEATERDAPQGMQRMLRDGWRTLLGSPFLLLATTLSLVSALLLAALQALILPVYFTQVGRPELLGFVLTALAAGMLVGGGVYALAGRRLSRRSWLLIGLLGSGAAFGIIATLASPGAVFAGAGILGAASGVFGSLVGVLMIERVPEAMRGRVLGTQNALLTAAPPLGIVAAAVLTEFAGLGAAALGLVAVWAGPLLLGAFAPPFRRLEQEGAGGARRSGRGP